MNDLSKHFGIEMEQALQEDDSQKEETLKEELWTAAAVLLFMFLGFFVGYVTGLFQHL